MYVPNVNEIYATRDVIKLKLLGDPAICIVSFKLKVAILNLLGIFITVKLISWLLN